MRGSTRRDKGAAGGREERNCWPATEKPREIQASSRQSLLHRTRGSQARTS
ncbi:hypothetical protein HPP92_006065 [Vanilla planifolia]|uniref:Uncharacterized protein n=1 Tax=Vanilla planifolia TaxID=51239 RepID=A0A835VFZ8_VANPL|nr:hypothetical protein HPP92_006065 [Vanilla planifolia]